MPTPVTYKDIKTSLDNIKAFKRVYARKKQKEKNQMKREGLTLFKNGQFSKVFFLHKTGAKKGKILPNWEVEEEIDGYQSKYEELLSNLPPPNSRCADCPICLEQKHVIKSCIQCTAEICTDCLGHLVEDDRLKCPLCRKEQKNPLILEEVVDDYLNQINSDTGIAEIYRDWSNSVEHDRDELDYITDLIEAEEKRGYYEFNWYTRQFEEVSCD